MHRRQWLKATLSASAAGVPDAPGVAAPAGGHGLPLLKITDVRTILTAPAGIRLVVVKVHTSEPGLYGLGCATFTQRARVVETAVERYLKLDHEAEWRAWEAQSSEIIARLAFLNNVGLDYLSLERSAETLSGGEAQRIRLASQLGSGLTGVM